MLACNKKQDIKSIEGKEYVLTKTLPGSEITIVFSENRVGGSAGVNKYSAEYSIDGKNIKFDKCALTRMMGPQELMTQENDYMKLLDEAKELNIEDNKIEITTTSGKNLIFEKK